VREQLFEDSVDMSNVQESISLGSLVDAQQTRESLEGKHVCPYCGAVNESPTGPCPNCSLENTPAGRKATKSRIGPWYVLQRRNPAAPGMKYDMLLNFVRKGRVKPRTIVRGPTTHQLWRFAAHVKGLSREFGLCYSCGGKIEPASTVCQTCNRLQLPPLNPDALLETGDAESPPGGMPMMAAPGGNGATASINGVDHEESSEAPAAATEEEANHDIVVPALTDMPAEPIAVASAHEFNGAIAVSEAMADGAKPEVAGIGSAALQSMNMETIGMSAMADAPAGARARSAALKAAGGLGGLVGPRSVPLGPTGASPAPVIPSEAPPVSFRGQRGRWRGAAEIVLFLLVLVGALGSVVFLVDSSIHQWVQTTYDRVLKGMHLKSDSDQPMPMDLPDQSIPSPTDNPRGSVPIQHDPIQIKPKPVVIPAPAAPPQAPMPPPVVQNDQPPAEVHPATPAPSDAGTGDKTAGLSDAAREETLYRAALAAEGVGDFAAAVKDYRQIMQLPQSVWRTDVEQRLHYDEGLLGSEK
jgi:hypothetical protein